jgi:hypothetical protein
MSGVRYIFEAGAPRRVMHIERHDQLGRETWAALCGIDLPFNRTINAPWGLGRRICKNCLRAAGETE